MSERYVRIGVDVGAARVGVARSDPDGMLATPIATFPRVSAVGQVADAAVEENAGVIIVGLPRSLNGSLGKAASAVCEFCEELADELRELEYECPIRLVDERLTTVSAHQALHAAGRKERRHRSVVDQVAAVMILQTALDTERATGRVCGDTFVPSASTGEQ
ncbi:Holliday junction resolvase RuvX [Dermabacteraceae bacterium P13264]